MPSEVNSEAEISVVIPTFQRCHRIATLLDHLRMQTLSSDRFEVVVVDDSSTDDTSGVVSALAPTLPFRVVLTKTPSNCGPAAARNLGWRTASSPLLAFIDDDVTPSAGWLQAGLAALHSQPDAGVIQGPTHVPAGVDLPNIKYGEPNWDHFHIIDQPTPYFEACNIFYRLPAIEAAGGFDERIGWWGEDTAVGWSVLTAGWDRGFAPEALVTHTVERRGWGWFMRNGLRERNFIRIGVDHPDFRDTAYWRSWAFRKEDAAFAAAIVGLLTGTRFRPALLLALPYVWWRRPSVRHLSFFRLCLQIPAVDAARLTGHLWGSLEEGVFVL